MVLYLLLMAVLLQAPGGGPQGGAQQVDFGRRARALLAKRPDGEFWVLREGERVARVTLEFHERIWGEERLIEVLLARRGKEEGARAEREVLRCRMDPSLSPVELRLFGAQEGSPQLAHLTFSKSKVAGRLGARELLRNLPGPVESEGGVLLRAALLARGEAGESFTFTRIAAEGRGARAHLAVHPDERLVRLPARGEGSVATPDDPVRIEHRDGRGKLLARYTLERSGKLLTREQLLAPPERWVRREDDEEP